MSAPETTTTTTEEATPGLFDKLKVSVMGYATALDQRFGSQQRVEETKMFAEEKKAVALETYATKKTAALETYATKKTAALETYATKKQVALDRVESAKAFANEKVVEPYVLPAADYVRETADIKFGMLAGLVQKCQVALGSRTAEAPVADEELVVAAPAIAAV